MTDSGMADLILRSAALEVINAVKDVTWSQSGKVLCGKMYSQIKDLPAVDAVPVEWLREKMRGYDSSLKSTETAALVMVMQMWQKEQEAQDE